MTANLGLHDRAFRKAVVISAAAHTILLALIILNPSLPGPAKKGGIQYLSLSQVGFLGGGSGGSGGGGGAERGGAKAGPQAKVQAAPAKKATLRDLTTAQKIKEESKTALRYPADKKKPAKTKPEKKAAITKPEPGATVSGAETSGTEKTGGLGSGLRIGAGGPGYGEGGGGIGGLAGQIGMSNFPYSYYLETIQDRISSNWFTSLVDPGVSGTFQVAVYFRIFKNGSISTVDIRESSGIESLDLSAKRAILQSAPFPPLPSGYNQEYLGIILIFEHTK